jgi:hypothetical protein
MISIDEDAALVEDAIEKERRIRLDPSQVSDVHVTIGDIAQTQGQIETLAIVCQVDHQIQIRVRILVAACQRAVKNSEPNTALGAKGATQAGEKLPMVAQVVVLARREEQPARTGSPGTHGPHRNCSTQSALLGTQLIGQCLDRSHVATIAQYMSVRCLKYDPIWPNRQAAWSAMRLLSPESR